MSTSGAGGSGRRLGRYHLAEPLGGGPTGEVFRAKVYGVAGFERQFAVKRFHTELVRDPEVAAQLAASTRMYGSLEHPRIARLHEYGVAGGETFTATELVQGVDLSRLFATTRSVGEPLLAGAVAALVSQIARAIGYAHGRGICHFGLCPTNLVCTPEGDVKVTDFGVLPPRLPARPGNDLTLAARIPYLAPEQLVGEQTGSATDVFQLGTIAYELFTGERCFTGATGFEIAQRILSSRPTPPTLPRLLVKVLERCLARSPFERYPDAGAMADALDAAVRSTPLPGAKRDIAVAVQQGIETLAAMHSGQISGALSFPLPAPPSAILAAAGAGHPGSEPERPSRELTGEGPTIPRQTLMGAVPPSGSFQIPTILPVSRPAAAAGDDEAPTQIRDRAGGLLRPAAGPPDPMQVAPQGRGEDSLPEIELSMADVELDPSKVEALPIAPPSPRVPAPPGFASQVASVSPSPQPMELDPLEYTPAPLLSPSRPSDELPEVAMLPFALQPEPEPEPLPQRAVPSKRGAAGVALAVVAALVVIGAGVFAYVQFFSGGDGASPAIASNGETAQVRSGGDDPPEPRPEIAPGDGAVAAADASIAAAVTDASPAVQDTEELAVTQGEPGKLTVESTPARAMVYVDGTAKGKTPITVDGIDDNVSLAVVLPGHKLHLAEISGTGVHRVALMEVSPPAGPAGIKVRCRTKNRYYVFVDGNDVGQLCPTERLGVDLGEHLVEIYDPETEQRHSFPINVKQTRNSARIYVD
ncbi:MAG TPA: serine/threonine-protein kinase [Kofleriaceae bacterium]|nr:serine/threonine-protein kinase [Kofleriaceae bacterium]